ncbi:hypothetical protein DL766_003355 [Monosporascus sp. MC13-8B]|uniref:N-acetyltransferase domain-containing protein n=1 Tax=Monosporascus cannonballus TaxID=155416 RepID=A0ABY0HE64_9PEZI|nr:hypothetical protein DL762_002377 [Monosporascus cannonballus]RYO99205.1 hypothetical protein DL763_001695 [Monosporascus cannonballus]RYP33606.1 hypothetical protein DL766_003355 [Monosporascus sp. MC13-8B]
MRAWSRERFARHFADPAEAQFKVVDEATGRLVAYSRWVLPKGMRGAGVRVKGVGVRVQESGPGNGNGEEEEEEGTKDRAITASEGQTEKKERTGDEHPDVAEGMHVELYREFFDGLARAGEKWGASEKLELSHLCTDPAYHGRGIGAALLKQVLVIADAEGVEVFLDAVPLARPLYERMGFAVVDKVEFPLARTRTGRNIVLPPSAEQQPSHTNNGPGVGKVQQQCQTTDTPSASSQVHLRGGCLSESVDRDFVYYLGTSAPRPAAPIVRPTSVGLPPSYSRRETADPPPPYQAPSRPPSYKSAR